MAHRRRGPQGVAMERQQFDDLARALAEGRLTRRRMLGVLGGGALASLGSPALAAKNRKKEDKHLNRRCIPSPKGCGLRSKSPKPCRRCCYTYRTVSASKGKCCQPNGYGCRSTAECCLGVCSVGLCQNEVIQLPPSRDPLSPDPPLPDPPLPDPRPPAPPPPPGGCTPKPAEAPCQTSQECCAEQTKYICGTSHGAGSNTCCGSLGASCGSTLSCCIEYMCQGGQCGPGGG
jgi:hypothetical protein